MYQGAIMSRLDQTYLYKLDRLKILIQKEIDAILTSEFDNLTMSQFFLLFAVKDLAEPNQRDIAEYLNVTPAAISRQMYVASNNNLVYISKQRTLNQSKIKLTKIGLDIFNKAYHIINNHLLEIFNNSEMPSGLSEHLDNLLINAKKGV